VLLIEGRHTGWLIDRNPSQQDHDRDERDNPCENAPFNAWDNHIT
jgi:hypothetical protein